jgi:transposase InsO family protein
MKRSRFRKEQIVGVLKEAEAGVPVKDLCRPVGVSYKNQAVLHFIERGKPTQNAFIESFNGKFRHECWNQNWFVDLRHAREVIEAWRVEYNTVRPHSSLGFWTPEEFAAAQGCGRDGGFATLENAVRFPLSPSRDDGPISTFAVEPKTRGASL